MKKILYTALFFLSLFSGTSFAQETKQEPEPFSKEWITAMYDGIQLKDMATVAHKWGYSFISEDKEKLSKLAGALTTKADGKVQLGSANGKYICSIEDNKIFSAQTLYDRVTYLNETAKSLGLGPMKTFGLMKEE